MDAFGETENDHESERKHKLTKHEREFKLYL